MPIIALIGRPNTGKSTLFNRLVGKKLAIVHKEAGATRDLREAYADIGGHPIRLVDTAGLEGSDAKGLSAQMQTLTRRAIAMADICLFLIDARSGLVMLDRELAGELRKSGKPVLLLANKAEGRGTKLALEGYELGLGEPIAISAEHGEGIGELTERLAGLFDELHAFAHADKAAPPSEQAFDQPDAQGEVRPIKAAIIGRPNCGKSSLMNALLGEERLLTGPEAGITRDAISFELDWRGTRFALSDTAGMRKRAGRPGRGGRSGRAENLEELSIGDTLRAVEFAELVILLIDSQSPFEQQDLRIAAQVEREGRAMIIAINKWDLVKDKRERLREMEEMVSRLLPQFSGVQLVPISALKASGLGELHGAALGALAIWNRRIQTNKLNSWLAGEIAHHPPPAPGGRRIKLRYITQAKTRPPRFVVKCSRPRELPASYKRFLVNGLRRSFGLWGTPIRLDFRADKNPYHEK